MILLIRKIMLKAKIIVVFLQSVEVSSQLARMHIDFVITFLLQKSVFLVLDNIKCLTFLWEWSCMALSVFTTVL